MVDTAAHKITTFLMFQGQAEEAMAFYTSLFDDAEVLAITRYGPDEPGAEGSVKHALFSLAGQRFMCIDSSMPQPFTFTPAISLYVQCKTEQEVDRLYAALSDKGEELLPWAATASAPSSAGSTTASASPGSSTWPDRHR